MPSLASCTRGQISGKHLVISNKLYIHDTQFYLLALSTLFSTLVGPDKILKTLLEIALTFGFKECGVTLRENVFGIRTVTKVKRVVI